MRQLGSSKIRRRSLLKTGAAATGFAAAGLLPSGGFAIRIVCLQHFHGFFVGVRKLRIDQPSRHPQVNPIFRQLERVRRPVMAVKVRLDMRQT